MYKVENLPKLDFEQFKEYYEQHSREETLKHFNLKRYQLTAICKLHNYKKPTSLVVAQRTKNNLAKYGIENVFQLEDVKKKCNTEEIITKANIARQETIAQLISLGIYEDWLTAKNLKTSETILTRYGSFENFYIQSVQAYKQTCLERYGVEHFSKSSESHKGHRRAYHYEDEYFDSSWELAVYKYAKQHNEPIVRCPCCFTFEFENKQYTYIPDFLYNGKLIEIKGDHFFKKDGTMCNPFDHSQDALYEDMRIGLQLKI